MATIKGANQLGLPILTEDGLELLGGVKAG